MTGKTQAARQPSIDELLTSIRQAIHERVTPGVPDRPDRSPSAVHTRPAARPAIGARDDDAALKTLGDRPAGLEDSGGSGAEGGRMKRTIVTSGREGFAGLLGGDVRLEEALARLNQPSWRRAAEAPVAPEAVNAPEAAAPAAPEPRLRPTIEDWTGEPAAPASGHRQRGEGSALPGASKRGAAEKDEFRRERAMHEDHGSRTQPAERPARTSQAAGDGDLLSSQAASAANSAFSRLTDATAPSSTGGDRPLDEMTRECLRPLLKTWLDENLPGLVERLVREEIARVARRGR